MFDVDVVWQKKGIGKPTFLFLRGKVAEEKNSSLTPSSIESGGEPCNYQSIPLMTFPKS
jgi:hypothetical protein